ncbi:hypothetical protein I546_4161 [Mycobacterium kansasii 732]|nr:hypothetical protein I546_4161 [Mycobacterium kansasii 732]
MSAITICCGVCRWCRFQPSDQSLDRVQDALELGRGRSPAGVEQLLD